MVNENNENTDALAEVLGAEERSSNGHKAVDAQSLASAFSQPQSSDPLKALLTPDDALVKLGMKSDLEGRHVAAAFGMLVRKYAKRHYTQGLTQLRLQLAAETGVGAKRAELVVDGLVGDKRNRQKSMMERFGGWVDGFARHRGLR